MPCLTILSFVDTNYRFVFFAVRIKITLFSKAEPEGFPLLSEILLLFGGDRRQRLKGTPQEPNRGQGQ